MDDIIALAPEVTPYSAYKLGEWKESGIVTSTTYYVIYEMTCVKDSDGPHSGTGTTVTPAGNTGNIEKHTDITTTAKNPDGSITTTTTDRATGAVTRTTPNPDGTSGTVKRDSSGKTVAAEATVSVKAAANTKTSGKAVELPIEVSAVKNIAGAVDLDVTIQGGGSARVEIPGIIHGSDGQLTPKANATRAQLAAIMMRFCVNRAR